MGDAPEKKRRKLTTALKEAIGAHAQKSEENIEKPLALALISDDKSAQDLLNKIQASRRPQAVLEATLIICKEKKAEAHVEEAFLSIFRKHFSVLGIDSAMSCWKLLEDHLNKSDSLNEILISCEFIGNANLLGHGFGKLLQTIKAGLPAIIRNVWNQDRKADSLHLAYSLVCLILAENVYGDDQSKSQSPATFWNENVLTEKSMKKNLGMRMISALAGNEERLGSLATSTEISGEKLEFLSKVFLNHFEFFAASLHKSASIQFLVTSIDSHLAKNELRLLAIRLESAEASVTSNLYYALISVLRTNFELSESNIISIEELETLKLKEVAKFLPSVCEITPSSQKTLSSSKKVKKLNDLLDFIRRLIGESENNRDAAAFSLLVVNISVLFETPDELCEQILKQAPKEVIGKLVKAGKGTDGKGIGVLKRVKKSIEEENAQSKFVNRSAAEVVDGLAVAEISVADAIKLIQGVHTAEIRKEVFDSIVKFVEDIPGGESLDEIRLFKLIIEMYGGGPLESLALQVILSRVATDGWTEMDRTPGTDQSEESWFRVLVQMIDLLETTIKSAKNSVLKSFTALFCQLFSQVLKNTQKFARHSATAVSSQTLSPEATTRCVLRRHKLIQDVARLVDAMKRNESYFAMLTASIIGDAVFYGSDSLLAMSKLHSLADRNASGLLATNLPVVERTRYKKFLSTITRASKRVY
ncbi:unnamed protein product [Caenorhabditis sp. 36 PRJEB53466]|nr:unnamed protein product [Caenorhabditis sp. 36 PRJEB53466]